MPFPCAVRAGTPVTPSQEEEEEEEEEEAREGQGRAAGRAVTMRRGRVGMEPS
jgi:hypothetical protein